MEEKLTRKAWNHCILGLYAERKGMNSESASNYFKAMFALADLILFQKEGKIANNHTERFDLLKETDPFLFKTLSDMFFIYRETYTKEISKERIRFVREKLNEIFDHTKVKKPTEKDL